MPKYPKVNYIGNKEKIVDWIISEMPVKEGTVLDIFAGGCSVSYALKKAGYSVISNDILFADVVIAKALIENNSTQLSRDVFEYDIDSNSLKSIRKRIEFLSDRLYYPEEIDELSRLLAIADKLEGYERYMFLALLRRAMIRKLPYSRMNVPWNQIQLLRDEEYSYKKYKRRRAYHNQSFTEHMIDNLDSYNNAIFECKQCCVKNMDVMELAENIDNVDIVYMDPPYPSTMNNYDAFYGLYDAMFGRELSHMDFTSKDSFLTNMETLISVLKDKTRYIVLSQNTRVKPEPDAIKEMLSAFGDVKVKEINHNYQVTGKENKNSSKELLFILSLD